MVDLSRREAIIEVVNRLFVYTDMQEWQKLLDEVFAEEVFFDMSSAGGAAGAKMAPSEICSMWSEGFRGIDAIHHQAGNYIVSIKDEVSAEVLCYAIATHYKNSARNGSVRGFAGSYNIMLVLTDLGWRINGFKYNLKYVNGNKDLD